MKPLHIVHLTATNPVDDIRVFQKECMSAVVYGHRVTLIVCHDHDDVIDGVHVRAMPKSRSRVSRMVGLNWKMYRESAKQGGDIYHLHHPDQIPLGLALKLRGKKVVYDTHESYRDKVLSMRWIPTPLRWLASKAFGIYERVTSAAWDHIVVADTYTAQTFRGRRVSVVPNFPLLIPVEASADKDRRKPILIYEGGLCDERGLEVMLETTRLLHARNVELQLLGWCCFPGDEERLRREDVRYMGKQNLQMMYHHLCAADIGLLLLQPVPAYAYAGENTNKLFEYMWCGLPVVASDLPNLRRIIEATRCGICVDPRDPKAISSAIGDLLDRPELCAEMGRNGREAVTSFYNWPGAGKVLMDVYESVMRKERKARDLGNGCTAIHAKVSR